MLISLETSGLACPPLSLPQTCTHKSTHTLQISLQRKRSLNTDSGLTDTHGSVQSINNPLNNTHIMLNIIKNSTVCSGKQSIRQSLGRERAALQAIHAEGVCMLALCPRIQPNSYAFISCFPANMLKASIQGSERTHYKGLKGILCFMLGVC